VSHKVPNSVPPTFQSTALSADASDTLPIVFSADEREEIIGHLLGRYISALILTPTQSLAIIEENAFREQGFPPVSPASNSERSSQTQNQFSQTFSSAKGTRLERIKRSWKKSVSV
jgi:hypothetical protein